MLQLLQKASGHEGDKISVIIPCYNREKYIRSCMDSVFSQTIPLEMLDVIVIDDRSTDDTWKILQEYEKLYPDKLLIVQCEEQSGGYIGKIRNIGMSYAQGAYITFVDSDDTIEPDMLIELYKNAVLYNADVVACGYRMLSNDVCLGEHKRELHVYDTSQLIEARALYMQESLSGHVWARLYKTEFLYERQLFFPEDRHISEDNYFHELSLMLASRYMCIDNCYYNYHYHTSSVWNSERALDYIMECFQTQIDLVRLSFDLGIGLENEIAWSVFGIVYGMLDKCKSMSKESIFWEQMPYIKEKLNVLLPDLKNNQYIYDTTNEDIKRLAENLFK